jgi:hypothetical protein
MIASQQGYVDVCLELINSGADVHLQMKVIPFHPTLILMSPSSLL